MRKLIQAVYHTFADTPVQRAKEKMREAQRHVADLAGEVAVHEHMSKWYEGEVASIDHTIDWWGYADARQKQQDHLDDLVYDTRKLQEAEAELQARVDHYFKLKREQE